MFSDETEHYHLYDSVNAPSGIRDSRTTLVYVLLWMFMIQHGYAELSLH